MEVIRIAPPWDQAREYYHYNYKWLTNIHTDYPPVKANIFDTEHTMEIQLLVPGWGKEDFKVEVLNDELTVSVKGKDKNSRNYSLREFCISDFSRTFTIPSNSDIQVNLEYGMLLISIIKEEEVKPSIIKVK